MNRHSFKLYFCMFEKSQRKHNSLDCHNNFWNIFHCLHTCSKLGGKKKLHVQNTQILRMDNPYFFRTSFFSIKCTPFLLKIKKIVTLMIRREKGFELMISF